MIANKTIFDFHPSLVDGEDFPILSLEDTMEGTLLLWNSGEEYGMPFWLSDLDGFELISFVSPLEAIAYAYGFMGYERVE